MLRRHWVWSLAWILGVAGCDCGDGATPGTCTTTADCPRSQMCAAGRCVARSDGGDMDAALPDGSRPMDAAPADGPAPDAPRDDGGVCATASGTPGPLPVDVIVMVDQSASTGEEADAIRANINTNLGDILAASGLDYRVILINSDTTRLCPDAPLGNPADCTASNPPRYYRILHPVNNSDELTLLLWTYDGDGKQPNSCHRMAARVDAWRDFVRFESLKVFIVFSDDDPTSYSRVAAPPTCPTRPGPSTYAGCTNADCLSTTGTSIDCGTLCPNFGCPTFADRAADWGGGDFPTELYALGPHRMVGGRMENPFGSAGNPRWVFNSLIGVGRELEPAAPVTDRCDLCASGGNTAENAGVTYQALSRLTGGLRYPSCNTDYSPLFRRISSSLAPIACEFLLESTGLGTIDPSRTNVVYFAGGVGSGETIPQDATVACDVGANGWQFSGGMSRIRICGPACDRIQADPMARVEIQVGCDAVTCPPACADGGVPTDSGACRPEICDNGIDDDCDGLVDNLDRDCILF